MFRFWTKSISLHNHITWNESLSAGFRQKPDVFSKKVSFSLVAIGRKTNKNKNIISFVQVETQCSVTLKGIWKFTQPWSKGLRKRFVLERMQNSWTCTAQKIKFSIKDFFRKLRIWSHLLKKSLMENFLFCAVLKKLIFKWNVDCRSWNQVKIIVLVLPVSFSPHSHIVWAIDA